MRGFSLQMQIDRFGTLGFSHIDKHCIPILTTARHERPFGHQAVFGEVAGMAFGRVAAPEDEESRPGS